VAEKILSKQQTEILGYNLVADPDCVIIEARVTDFIKQTGYSFTDLLNKSELLTQLKLLPLFRSLASNKLESIVSKIRVEHFNQNDTIITEGDEGNKLYIIKRGSVDIFIKGNVVRKLNESEYFGDRALFFKEPRSATVKAHSEFVELLSLENDDFKMLLETNLKEYLINRLVLQDNKVELKDLDVIKEIHKGELSVIYVVKNKKTKYLYALKRFPCDAIVSEKTADKIFNEKHILLSIDHPFIVRIVKALKDDKNVYYLLEFVKGERLSIALYEMGLLNKNQTQFYFSGILILIEALHLKNIIHRDIRPENILITENGYIKVVDFITAKEVKERCTTLIGSPYYMAPEVILSEGYTYSCDLWSAAICAFEFHCGTVPFGDSAEDPMQVYLAIINQ
jgi:cGMP-dependent protein kinase